MPYPNTLIATSFEDAFSIPLACFRNQGWNPSFLISDDNDSPIDISGDRLALMIVPLSYDGITIGDPILTDKTFTVDSTGAAVFNVSKTDLDGLSPEGTYQWFLERQELGQTDSSVVVAGPLQVSDSPPFPP
jgi:hypothetical protein